MGGEAEMTVLLVDDDEQQKDLVTEYLRHAMHGRIECDWVQSYAQAFVLLQDPVHDAVLLDHYLGSEKGLDLLTDIPDLVSRVPVIVLTGRDDPELDRLALERGACDYLDKNQLTPLLLERTIRYAVSNFRAQQALRDSMDRFEGLLNAVFEGVVVHDGERILEVNAPFLRMMERHRDGVVGAPLHAVFDGTLEPLVTQTLLHLGAPLEFSLARAGGSEQFVEARCRRHDFEGKEAYLLALSDITPRKRAEDVLAHANAELERRVRERTDALQQSNQELERFAQVVAHDIQSPLRTVEQYIEELRARESRTSDGDTELRLHFVDRAIQTVLRMQELISAVLEYSRITASNVSMTEVDLNAVVQEVLLDLEPEYRQVDAVIEAGYLPRVFGNGPLLADLFRNLLHNALKYRREGTTAITISVQEWDQHWLIAVRDNGVGFRPDEAELLFVALHRGANTAGQPGHGLGLATCKKIVEVHGGHIWARSQPGAGATFLFTMPKRALSGPASLETEAAVHEDHLCG